MCVCIYIYIYMGFPDGADSKEYACNAGDPDLTRRLVRTRVEGNGNQLQYFSLENSMYRVACWATAHRVTKSQT